jgi:hypothetical protein
MFPMRPLYAACFLATALWIVGVAIFEWGKASGRQEAAEARITHIQERLERTGANEKLNDATLADQFGGVPDTAD